ncbi:MAG TPA: trehalose-6-phosphate synthase [Mycobacteriales bacterium]
MRLIVVNDRCFLDPAPRTGGGDGPVRGELDPGGLATALTREDLPKLFVSSARTPAQAELGARGGVAVVTPDGEFRVRLVRTDEAAYRAFYDVAANRLLWLVHHGCWPRSDVDAADVAAYEHGYRTVNANLAAAVAEEVRDDGGTVHVLWQDYQTYLAPALVRRLLPPAALDRTVLQHFLHVPFPGPPAWRALPGRIVRELLAGLLGNDLVGFQTPAYAAAFVECCRDHLGVVPVRGGVRAPDGRPVRVGAYPIPAATGHLRATVHSGRTRRLRGELAAGAYGRRTVFRTERVDPVKAFPDALRAFDRVLRRPGLAGTARYVAQLVPARMSIPDWVAARDEAVRVAAEVNARWPGGPPPVELRVERDFERVVAAYQDYDVLDVVPRADGMNLVALEGPVVNTRDGVLVLSTAAGAYGVLRPHPLGVQPGDVDGHADALERALRMPAAERAARAAGLRERAAAGDPSAWLRAQVRDGATAAAGRR